MTKLVAGRTAIGVHQRRKLFEMRNHYTLSDGAGIPIGTVEQVEQSPFTVLARFASDLDVALPVTLALVDEAGAEVARLHKPWFRYAVTVTDARGAVLGRITKRVRVGKAVFSVTGPLGDDVGELRALNWRAREFSFTSPAGRVNSGPSAVVARGAGSMPSVILVWTNPGRTTMVRTPVPCSASPSPCVNQSMPALDEP